MAIGTKGGANEGAAIVAIEGTTTEAEAVAVALIAVVSKKHEVRFWLWGGGLNCREQKKKEEKVHKTHKTHENKFQHTPKNHFSTCNLHGGPSALPPHRSAHRTPFPSLF